jgi:hypothetical protein
VCVPTSLARLLRNAGRPTMASEWVAQRSAGFEPVTNACGSVPDPCCGPVRVAEISQFGKASWYPMVGGQTTSGEILDTVPATAAHRSLPLASYAKVTNLDNRRSVIVSRSLLRMTISSLSRHRVGLGSVTSG